MPNDPVDIISPTGGRATVQRSAVPAHLRRGWKLAEPGAVEHPPKSAPKSEWKRHAVELGIDPDEAESATKDELIDKLAD